MKIAYDLWFEGEPLRNVLDIIEFVEEAGNVLWDIRRRYGEDFGSRYGGRLIYREVSLEEAATIKEKFGWK